MQERYDLSAQRINRDLLSFVRSTPWWFLLLFLLLGGGVAAMLAATGHMVYLGLVVTGLDRPVYWGFLITNFVYWVGMSQAGVMMSSILRLTQAEWRRPITRMAEVLTVVLLLTASYFPLIHTGRPWRTLYWILPYDFPRNIWPNIRSPLIWDPAAIFTYLFASSMIVLLSLIPDMAAARTRATGWQRHFFALLSFGFRGTPRQWRVHSLATVLMAAMIIPVFVTVHSIVAWDFGVQLVPGYHSTVLAPYFVIAAMNSGVAAIITFMVFFRFWLRLDRYITADHFDAIGRLQIAVAVTWLFFYFLDFFGGMVSQEAREVAVWQLRLTVWPYPFMLAVMFLTSFFIPVPLLLIRRVRRNAAAILWIALLINVGMWIERLTVVVPPPCVQAALHLRLGLVRADLGRDHHHPRIGCFRRVRNAGVGQDRTDRPPLRRKGGAGSEG
ncbi:MAG TPA: NrfD/PsrC family molybdoenzyme membrane anchor subunit [Chloroflexota bacterium]|nr:NrfD/PsrC family molybdoenzyme membrane anchor subunit [Chloroflexota bacterium]